MSDRSQEPRLGNSSALDWVIDQYRVTEDPRSGIRSDPNRVDDPEHIVRLTWYLTSGSEYESAGAGIGAAWKQTLARNFPPSTLLYIDGLVDLRAKVEIEVTAFVPAT